MTDVLTLLDDDPTSPVRSVPAHDLGDDVAIAPTEIGWHLRPEGLCRGDVCVPVRDARVENERMGVLELARLTGRLAVVDRARRIAAVGRSAQERGEAMRSLTAPDFTLPDPDGRPVSLHDFGRRKRLLLAWSSW